jgi:hypothetical protein
MWVLLLPLAELLTLYMNFISLGILFVSRLLVRESISAAAAEPTTFTQLFYSQVGGSKLIKFNYISERCVTKFHR